MSRCIFKHPFMLSTMVSLFMSSANLLVIPHILSCKSFIYILKTNVLAPIPMVPHLSQTSSQKNTHPLLLSAFYCRANFGSSLSTYPRSLVPLWPQIHFKSTSIFWGVDNVAPLLKKCYEDRQGIFRPMSQRLVMGKFCIRCRIYGIYHYRICFMSFM